MSSTSRVFVRRELSSLLLLAASACASGTSDRVEQTGAQTIGATPATPAGSTAKPGATATPGTAPGSTAVPATTGAGLPVTIPSGPEMLGGATQSEAKSYTDRYAKATVTRNGQSYRFMANGWGPKFKSQSISVQGTAFTVLSFEGDPGDKYEPAGYPTVFCGKYTETSPACGLPKAVSELKSVRTGWRWSANGNNGQYNAAYDIWVGDGTKLQGYLMVWLRDPIGQQPAGSPELSGISVANVPGKWDLWTGSVNGLPIINWVKPEGEDLSELEFDVLDFVKDAKQRGLEVPGTHINAVAVGFEIWQGPVANLKSEDFYVQVQ